MYGAWIWQTRQTINNMKDLINWHELSRKLSGNGQNIRPNKIPQKYEKKIARLLKVLEVWERWQNKA